MASSVQAGASNVLERVFDASNVCIAHLDREGRFFRVNRAFAATHELEPEAFAGRLYRDIYEEQGAADLYDELAGIGADALVHVLVTGEPVVGTDLPWRFPQDPGRVVYYDWTLSPVATDEQVESLVFVSVDITARHDAEGELRRVGTAQAALRRVATLVASEGRPSRVYAAVAREAAQLFGGEAGLFRYDAGTATVVGGHSTRQTIARGEQFPLGGRNVTTIVRETGRPARIDRYSDADASRLTTLAKEGSIGSSAGAPIFTGGDLWGVVVVSAEEADSLPEDAEARLSDFAELVAAAIANAEARHELTESRARIVASADDARRRIERNLHDGPQQRLVSLTLQLRAAQASVPPELEGVRAEIDRVAAGMSAALDELREVAHGIHPAILVQGGLPPALRKLARRSHVPVILDVSVHGRLPAPVEVAAYYVVSEALANAAKHARASCVHVTVGAEEDVLRVAVDDDGVGGADAVGGSGLLGVRDRVAALGGRLAIESPAAGGTSLRVELPMS